MPHWYREADSEEWSVRRDKESDAETEEDGMPMGELGGVAMTR